jgi:hypothetical protein
MAAEGTCPVRHARARQPQVSWPSARLGARGSGGPDRTMGLSGWCGDRDHVGLGAGLLPEHRHPLGRLDDRCRSQFGVSLGEPERRPFADQPQQARWRQGPEPVADVERARCSSPAAVMEQDQAASLQVLVRVLVQGWWPCDRRRTGPRSATSPGRRDPIGRRGGSGWRAALGGIGDERSYGGWCGR